VPFSGRAARTSEPLVENGREAVLGMDRETWLVAMSSTALATVGASGRSEARQPIYRFSQFELDPSSHELLDGGRSVDLPQKCVELLAYLIRHRDRSVPRAELLRAVWADVKVHGGSVTQAIWLIRKALRCKARHERLIETVRGRGYRFLGPVEVDCPHALELNAGPRTARTLRAALTQPDAWHRLDASELLRIAEGLCRQPWSASLRQRTQALTREALLTALELTVLMSGTGAHSALSDLSIERHFLAAEQR
jgi:DNA-binding winged helix-turn-helix (wHTH) protein